MTTVTLDEAIEPRDIDAARTLVDAYVRGLGVNLDFQGIETEMRDFPAGYSAPRGCILLARVAGEPAGCVALRPAAEPGVCEMKRLYVPPVHRGHRLGERLVEGVLARARDAGYARIRLDTLAGMDAARGLYARFGFHPIEPYYDNPIPGAGFFELDLAAAPSEGDEQCQTR